MKKLSKDVAKGDVKYHRLSAAAYKPETIAAQDAALVGFTMLKHVHDHRTGADAIIFENDHEVVIAFRGTEKNHKDIITDLKFRKTSSHSMLPSSSIKVHRGFLAQWESIRPDIYSCISRAHIARKRVVATGHSLGGALAILAALNWRWISSCITFGAPRVGDFRIRDLIACRATEFRRYVFGADVVPIIPLMTMGYRHGQRPIYLTRNGKAIEGCPLWREMIGRSRSLLSVNWAAGWTWCPVPTRLYTDHRIGEYGSALARAQQ